MGASIVLRGRSVAYNARLLLQFADLSTIRAPPTNYEGESPLCVDPFSQHTQRIDAGEVSSVFCYSHKVRAPIVHSLGIPGILVGANKPQSTPALLTVLLTVLLHTGVLTVLLHTGVLTVLLHTGVLTVLLHTGVLTVLLHTGVLTVLLHTGVLTVGNRERWLLHLLLPLVQHNVPGNPTPMSD